MSLWVAVGAARSVRIETISAQPAWIGALCTTGSAAVMGAGRPRRSRTRIGAPAVGASRDGCRQKVAPPLLSGCRVLVRASLAARCRKGSIGPPCVRARRRMDSAPSEGPFRTSARRSEASGRGSKEAGDPIGSGRVAIRARPGPGACAEARWLRPQRTRLDVTEGDVARQSAPPAIDTACGIGVESTGFGVPSWGRVRDHGGWRAAGLDAPETCPPRPRYSRQRGRTPETG